MLRETGLVCFARPYCLFSCPEAALVTPLVASGVATAENGGGTFEVAGHD